jgi:sulfur relay (sulfurtransferase) complex TusBCD TusD component (DsrE family)
MKTDRVVLSLVLAGLGASAGFAQDAGQKSKAEVRSITGCLSNLASRDLTVKHCAECTTGRGDENDG